MSYPHLMVGASLLLMISLPLIGSAEEELITAVSSKVSSEYVRTKLADGSYSPEQYSFGPGGQWNGMRDYSIDNLKFIDVAKIIAEPLAAQNFVPAKDPNTTRLLIMVYWGLTTPPNPATESPAYINLENAQANLRIALSSGDAGAVASARDNLGLALDMVEIENQRNLQTDLRNASMIGFDGEIKSTEGYAKERRRKEVLEELEDNRYFVVLMAYDFQMLWKQKKHKLLWETRFSIRQRNNDFDQKLAVMAREASRYFGQDSHGLIRKAERDGHIDLGELKIIGVEPEKK